jgi:hypothetical protein
VTVAYQFDLGRHAVLLNTIKAFSFGSQFDDEHRVRCRLRCLTVPPCRARNRPALWRRRAATHRLERQRAVPGLWCRCLPRAQRSPGLLSFWKPLRKGRVPSKPGLLTWRTLVPPTQDCAPGQPECQIRRSCVDSRRALWKGAIERHTLGERAANTSLVPNHLIRSSHGRSRGSSPLMLGVSGLSAATTDTNEAAQSASEPVPLIRSQQPCDVG